MSDRRKFLFQSGAAVGGFLVNPTAGVLGLLATTLGGQDAAGDARAARPPRELLRTGTPINGAGHPFGGRVSAMTAVRAADGRYVVVAAHERGAKRLSIFEVALGARGWDHDVKSDRNQVFGADAKLPLDGARMRADGPLFRMQSWSDELGEIRALAVTPWNTVLCAERDGFIVEIDPLGGIAIKRLSLGRVNAEDIRVEAAAGQSAVVYLRGGSAEEPRLFKFVSHQRFHERESLANHSLLVMGELFVAGDESATMWLPVTHGLEAEAWRDRVLRPHVVDAARVSVIPQSSSVAQSVGAAATSPSAAVRFVLEHTEDSSAVWAHET